MATTTTKGGNKHSYATKGGYNNDHDNSGKSKHVTVDAAVAVRRH